MRTLGDLNNDYFSGHMESGSVRRYGLEPEFITENYLYASPTSFTDNNNTRVEQTPFFLSFNSETGFGQPLPMQGFSFTGCAPKGTCTYGEQLFEERFTIRWSEMTTL